MIYYGPKEALNVIPIIEWRKNKSAKPDTSFSPWPTLVESEVVYLDPVQ